MVSWQTDLRYPRTITNVPVLDYSVSFYAPHIRRV
jgi:hypothetical protein